MSPLIHRLKEPIVGYTGGSVKVPAWTRVVVSPESLESTDPTIKVSVGGKEYEVARSEVVNLKGLMVFVYREAEGSDCTIGGITSRYTRLLLTGEGVRGSVEEREEMPAVVIVTRDIRGGLYRHAEPVDGMSRRGMFGGNFIQGCDSRVVEACPPYGIIPVHDRYE